MAKRNADIDDVTLRTLEETPARAVQFLRTVGTSLPVRTALMKRGYGNAEHARGWKLVQDTSGWLGNSEEPATDRAVADAIAELDSLDEDLVRLVRSASRRHPEAIAHVLNAVTAGTGAQAVLAVERVLAQLDTLEDTAALATLAKRGIDDVERARLSALVKQAKKLNKLVEKDAEAEREAEDAYLASLREMRDWYEEWSEIARASVKRRDYLIRLGLASRKTSDKEEAPPTPASA